MKLLWCTDTHFDFLSPSKFSEFTTTLGSSECDGILFTGDISTAKGIVYHLDKVVDAVDVPVYVVLGNHDFYGSSIAKVRAAVSNTAVTYLPDVDFVRLSEDTALVGHDGWYDCYYGNGIASRLVMTDFHAIEDFANLPNRRYGQSADEGVLDKARELAAEGASHISKSIGKAAKQFSNIVVATHFAPWPQASTYQGKQSDDTFLPFFSSRLMGLVLDQAALQYPDVNFTVLAGHSHGHYDGMIHPNMRCIVGAAEYGAPQIQAILEFA